MRTFFTILVLFGFTTVASAQGQSTGVALAGVAMPSITMVDGLPACVLALAEVLGGKEAAKVCLDAHKLEAKRSADVAISARKVKPEVSYVTPVGYSTGGYYHSGGVFTGGGGVFTGGGSYVEPYRQPRGGAFTGGGGTNNRTPSQGAQPSGQAVPRTQQAPTSGATYRRYGG